MNIHDTDTTPPATRAAVVAVPNLGALAIEMVREFVRLAEKSSHSTVGSAVTFLNEVARIEQLQRDPGGPRPTLRVTPGPYRTVPHHQDDRYLQVIGPDNFRVPGTDAVLATGAYGGNAHLFGAAWDMRAALVRNREGLHCRSNVLAQVGRADCDCWACETARETDAALRKAAGLAS